MRLGNLWLKTYLSVRLYPSDEKRRYPVGCPGQTEKGSVALLMCTDGDEVKAPQYSHTFLRLQNHFKLSKMYRWETSEKQIIFHTLGKKRKLQITTSVSSSNREWKISCSWESLPLHEGDLQSPELHLIRSPRGEGIAESVTALKPLIVSQHGNNLSVLGRLEMPVLQGLNIVCPFSDGPPQNPQEVLNSCSVSSTSPWLQFALQSCRCYRVLTPPSPQLCVFLELHILLSHSSV